jgi:hypothetical protein
LTCQAHRQQRRVTGRRREAQGVLGYGLRDAAHDDDVNDYHVDDDIDHDHYDHAAADDVHNDLDSDDEHVDAVRVRHRKSHRGPGW